MSSIAPGRAGVGPRQQVNSAGRSLVRPGRLLVILGILLALAPPAYLLQTGGALTTGYTIQNLERERAAWLMRNKQLDVEIARARSLVWVEHEAVYRLGMRRPAEQTVVRMDVPPPAPVQVQAAAAPPPRVGQAGFSPASTADERSGDANRSWLAAIGTAMSGLLGD